MNYEEQQKYFDRGRVLGTLAAAVIILLGAALADAMRSIAIPLLAVIAAIAVSLIYSPDYLHLSVIPEKRARWAVMIRWRIAAAVFLFGITLRLITGAPSVRSILLSTALLVVGNVVAKSLPRMHTAAWLWISDLSLLFALLFWFNLRLTLADALLALSAHLFLVASDRRLWWWAAVATLTSVELVFLASNRGPLLVGFDGEGLLLLLAVFITTVLVHRSKKQNDKNVSAAMGELSHFTGYTPEKIREMWATSNQQLARNWEAARLEESDAEAMAAWYRENSELYMFAISAYNLEYKRIRSNLTMMHYGSGKCLDYGAGNGELILEMARRGCPAVYYDVEGTSMKFARSRAEQRGLSVEFYHAKDGLKESAARKPFDTIFSFDVLEHIPDLAGELDFLASLLAPGGSMVFDVPAGSTKAHPMHLNHNLNVRAHMLSKGMVEERLGWSFRKQEKYLFRAPASS